MEINKNKSDIFKDKLDLLKSQFLIAMDRYRQSLHSQYLEGKDTSDETKHVESIISDIYSKAFVLTGEINSNVVKNNKKIQSLDEYLSKLKKQVDAENNKLKIIKGTQKAAIPREKEIKELLTENYIETGAYLISILASIYFIYKL